MAAPENNVDEKFLRWVDKSRRLAGLKILCIGIGRASALHLARVFPASSIVCLTKGAPEEAVVDGGDLAGSGRGGLREPLWINECAESYSGGLFDTVIACRLHPLVPADPEEAPADGADPADASARSGAGSAPAGGFPRWERGTFYLRRASLLMEYYEKETRALCRHLRPGGTLLHFVRGEQDEYFLGYCLALAAEEMLVTPEGIRQILCRADGDRMVCQGLTAFAGGRTDIQALIAQNLNFSLDRMNTSTAEYEGRGAELLLQADAGTLVRGYHIYQGPLMRGKLAVYTSVRNPDGIYYFTDVAGDVPYLRRFHVRDRQAVIRHMVGELHRQKAADKTIHWQELEMHEDWSETEL